MYYDAESFDRKSMKNCGTIVDTEKCHTKVPVQLGGVHRKSLNSLQLASCHGEEDYKGVPE